MQKYKKLILSWVLGLWHPASSCQAAPGSPRLASAVDRNWTLQQPAMDEESKTLVIPQI